MLSEVFQDAECLTIIGASPLQARYALKVVGLHREGHVTSPEEAKRFKQLYYHHFSAPSFTQATTMADFRGRVGELTALGLEHRELRYLQVEVFLF